MCEAPVPGPRHPRLLDPYEGYLRERVELGPGLSGKRLFRAIRSERRILTTMLRTAASLLGGAQDRGTGTLGERVSRPVE